MTGKNALTPRRWNGYEAHEAAAQLRHPQRSRAAYAVRSIGQDPAHRAAAQEALDVLGVTEWVPFYQVRQTLNLGLYGADFVIGPVQLGVEIVDVMGQHLDHVFVEFVG
jgi:hypothetical protein